MQIRCSKKLFGEIIGRTLEVKCKSVFCGSRPGVVVLHRFDLETGILLETNRFKDPNWREVKKNAIEHDSSSVRAS